MTVTLIIFYKKTTQRDTDSSTRSERRCASDKHENDASIHRSASASWAAKKHTKPDLIKSSPVIMNHQHHGLMNIMLLDDWRYIVGETDN